MATARALYRRAQKVDIDSAIQDAFLQNKEYFEEQNRKQLTAGFDKQGARLRRYRSPKYARVKNAVNPLPGLGNPDLKVTGAFHRGIHIARFTPTALTLTSTNSKAENLLKSYPNVLGLGGTYKKDFINTRLRPAFIRNVRKPIGL